MNDTHTKALGDADPLLVEALFLIAGADTGALTPWLDDNLPEGQAGQRWPELDSLPG